MKKSININIDKKLNKKNKNQGQKYDSFFIYAFHSNLNLTDIFIICNYWPNIVLRLKNLDTNDIHISKGTWHK